MRALIAMLACVLAAGCRRGAVDVPRLRLVAVEPATGPLYLNQEILLTFDRRIDPLSVTRDTVRIVEADTGLRVGLARIKVRSFTVHCVPRAPTDPELSNGDFKPGRRYVLQVSHFPRSHAVRGARGEVLADVAPRAWRSVDPNNLPPSVASPLLPTSATGRFRLVAAPSFAADGSSIELRFDRPVFPPSAVPASFTLKTSTLSRPSSEVLALRRVEVLRDAAPGGVGSSLRLYPVRPLTSGIYELWFAAGSRGVLDYRLAALTLPGDPSTRVSSADLGERLSPMRFERGRGRALVEEQFGRIRAGLDVDPRAAELGLAGDVEGRLAWGPDGLRTPRLDWPSFESLGDLEPPPATRRLVAGAEVEVAPGRVVKLPKERWDFDRFVIPKGRRVYVVLDPTRQLEIRVAGRFEVHGELVFQFKGPAARRSRGVVLVGDPRPTWREVRGRVAIEVAGICRLGGHILSDPENLRVPGFLWGRGPFVGDWHESAVEPWLRPKRATTPRGVMDGPLLPGRWVAVSPWYEMPPGTRFAGRVESDLSADRRLDIDVQAEPSVPAGARSSWGEPENLRRLGEISTIRFVVRFGGLRANGERLLSRLGIR